MLIYSKILCKKSQTIVYYIYISIKLRENMIEKPIIYSVKHRTESEMKEFIMKLKKHRLLVQAKKNNPRTPGQRHQKKIKKDFLAQTSNLIKNLAFNLKWCAGRSSITGHITAFHRQVGHKRLYRPITFFNRTMLGIVVFISYDPNRACFIQNTFDFFQKKFSVSLAPSRLCTGAVVVFRKHSRDKAFFSNYLALGYRTFLKNMPHGSLFFGLHLNTIAQLPIAQYARSAGTFCHLLQQQSKKSLIRLPSGLVCSVSNCAVGTLGIVSNLQHRFFILGKAGRARLLGKRPHVRGVAMNPVDHPHGGRTKPGRPSVTPWGRPSLGYKTKKI